MATYYVWTAEYTLGKSVWILVIRCRAALLQPDLTAALLEAGSHQLHTNDNLRFHRLHTLLLTGFESNLDMYLLFLRVQYISLSLKGVRMDYEKIQAQN